MKEALIQIISGFVGTVGFAIIVNIRGKRFLFTALGGLGAWALYLLLGLVLPGEPIRYFLVALVICIYSEIMARVLKTPISTFLTTSLISLVPGGSLYYTMSHALMGDYSSFFTRGIHTLKLASALALGIIVAMSAVKLIRRIGARRKEKQ